MTDPIELIPVEPIGTRRVSYLGDEEYVEIDDYSPDDVARGKALNELRLGLEMDIRTAADLLGIRPTEVAKVELGGLRVDVFEYGRRLHANRGS